MVSRVVQHVFKDGGLCNDHCVANSVMSLAVKDFKNLLILREFIDMSKLSCFSSQCIKMDTAKASRVLKAHVFCLEPVDVVVEVVKKAFYVAH